jgi:hypothetical protein
MALLLKFRDTDGTPFFIHGHSVALSIPPSSAIFIINGLILLIDREASFFE